jgi:transcriptional regulator with XRE-family HTH domain
MQAQLPPNRLSELIAARDVKLVHLGSHCDVDTSTISRWRSGEIRIPDDQKIRLAGFFDVKVSYLMGWDGPTEAAA